MIFCFILIFLLPHQLLTVEWSNGTLSRWKRVQKSRVTIVDPSLVTGPNSLLNLAELTTRNLEEYIGEMDHPTTTEKALEFVATYGLLANERECEQDWCSQYMSLVKDSSKKNDMLVWRCSTCKSDGMSSKVSIRENSFFEGLRIPLQKVLYIAADWIENPTKTAKDSAAYFETSENTISDYHEWFRDMTQQWWEREAGMNKNIMLGGPGTIVEIDESAMYKAKYHRGHMLRRPTIWIFGMLERGTGKAAMFVVPRRNRRTLFPLIQAHVRPQTLIVSDGWKAYGGLKTLQQKYDHKWVNHKVNFVDPMDRRVHTQGIESTWNAFKKSVKNFYGVKKFQLQGHLFSYMFRRFHNRKYCSACCSACCREKNATMTAPFGNALQYLLCRRSLNARMIT
ncbi:hypothetical protein GCK72_007265 [Caenorhabditis remanei]|uniref:ISXO2-like transposase domain-containing protein n=1 Tax=Caenorhabditis remanei TaxID=31234 RepID=A0A6A5HKV3_CAERE|nr:hypothetical protein GCK72_007265 [Caenorhabditis remanei]KAF1767306.1 hypothetical protein GCK72_007265 [Caenorhabditis remanei]